MFDSTRRALWQSHINQETQSPTTEQLNARNIRIPRTKLRQERNLPLAIIGRIITPRDALGNMNE